MKKRGSTIFLAAGILAGCALLAATPRTAAAGEGIYFGPTIGYAHVSSSDDFMKLQDDKMGRLGIGLRLGYNIFGYGSVEVNVAANGHDITDNKKREGGGSVTGIGKFHPMYLWRRDLWVDPYVGAGFGWSIQAAQPGERTKYNYNPPLVDAEDEDGISFKGLGPLFTIGAEVYIVPSFSVGLSWLMQIPSFSTAQYNEDVGDIPYESGVEDSQIWKAVDAGPDGTVGRTGVYRNRSFDRWDCSGATFSESELLNLSEAELQQRATQCTEKGVFYPKALDKEGGTSIHYIMVHLTLHVGILEETSSIVKPAYQEERISPHEMPEAAPLEDPLAAEEELVPEPSPEPTSEPAPAPAPTEGEAPPE